MLNTVYLGRGAVKRYAVPSMPQPPKIRADEVLDHALTLLEEGGEAAVTVRALAGRLGVTPNALYWHHADRDALLTALAGRGTGELRAALAQAAPGQVHALPDLAPVADAYLHFARTRPHLYALITTPRTDPSVSADLWAYVLGLLGPQVGAERAPAVGVALWAYLHGVAGLEALLHDGKPQEGAAEGLRALLLGLQGRGSQP